MIAMGIRYIGLPLGGGRGAAYGKHDIPRSGVPDVML